MIKEDNILQVLREVGSFLVELTKISKTVIPPESPEELNSLVAQVFEVKTREVTIPLYTPICPDWSRDNQGRYDFRALGDGVSFIAEKFSQEAPPLLGLFARFGIPYEGDLLLADFGLETEVVAKDTYGVRLSQEEIESCFASTLKLTKKMLEGKKDGEDGELFKDYRVLPMTDFFSRRGFDAENVYREMVNLFRTRTRGIRLVEELHRHSFSLNKKRLGLTSEEENKELVTKNLAEYATLGQSLGEKGIIIACESRISSKAYNLFREMKLPVFYIKGKKEGGENIL
jgi:hypothetical protein